MRIERGLTGAMQRVDVHYRCRVHVRGAIRTHMALMAPSFGHRLHIFRRSTLMPPLISKKIAD